MNLITKSCACGATFETEECQEFRIFEGTQCTACEEKSAEEFRAQQEAEAEMRRKEKRERFVEMADKITPARILQTDVHSPLFNRALWAEVTKWKPTDEKPWLGLVGNPGEAKTRCAFLYLRQYALERADQDCKYLSCAVISGMDFNRLAVERFSKEKISSGGYGAPVAVAETAASVLREARNARLLLFDELGKVRSSAGTIDELFALLDYRHSENLPTIWTSNRTPEEFCTAWPEEFAGPAAGRIIEASTIIRA